MEKNTKFKNSDFKKFKSLLKKKKGKAVKELDLINSLLTDQKRHIANTDQHFGSDSSEIRNKEMLKKMRRNYQKKVEKYDTALEKIDNKTYGICEKTGNYISKQRLLAMPEAKTCIKMI